MAAMRSGAKPSSKYDDWKSSGPETLQPCEDCLASCDLRFYDSEVTQTSYGKSCGRVEAGNGLIVVAWNSKATALEKSFTESWTP